MTSVANFNPSLLELYRRAYQEPVEIKVGSYNQAIAYRHRMYKLRRAMIEESHYMASVAARVSFHITENPDGTATLTARPADASFTEQLRAAGVNVDLKDLPPEEQPTASEQVLDEFRRKR